MILTNTKGASKVYILIVITTCLVCLTGLSTEPRFSDEIFHYWFALEWFEKGTRPVYNALVDTIEEFQRFHYYFKEPLWHFGLSSLMWVFGPSMALAQMYQAFFFGLLGIGTYLLARELYGEETGFYALILTISTPFFLAFGVLYFLDLPVASLAPFLLLSLKRGQVFFCGVVLGAMLLMKANSYLLLPALVLLAFTRPECGIKKGIRDLSIVLAIAILMNIPDRSSRLDKKVPLLTPTPYLSSSSRYIPPPSRYIPPPDVSKCERVSNIYFTESITFPSNALKFLGIVLPVFFLFTLAKYYRQLGKDDLWVLLPICLYIPLYLFLLKHCLAVRYLSPILPLLVVFASKGIREVGERRVLRTLLIMLCLAQAVATLGYVYKNRRLTPMEKEAIKFITSEIPQEDRIFTPEGRFISYYTGRPTSWVRSLHKEVNAVLWGGIEDTRKILHKYNIRYVLIQKARIYDDSHVRHYGGYPVSFIKKLPFLAQKVWENNSMSLWRIM